MTWSSSCRRRGSTTLPPPLGHRWRSVRPLAAVARTYCDTAVVDKTVSLRAFVAAVAACGVCASITVGCGASGPAKARPEHARASPTTTDHIPGERLRLYTARRQHLSGLGVSIVLPRGWSGHIYKRIAPTPTYGVIMHISNLHLLYPDGYDADAGISNRLAKRDVLIVLTEHAPPRRASRYPRLKPPLVVVRANARVEGVPDLHASALRFFSTSGRYFDLVVQFGTRPAPSQVIHEVNDVLATLRISPRRR